MTSMPTQGPPVAGNLSEPVGYVFEWTGRWSRRVGDRERDDLREDMPLTYDHGTVPLVYDHGRTGTTVPWRYGRTVAAAPWT